MQDGMWGNGKAMRTFFSQYDASQVDVWMADRISIYKLGFRDHPFQKLDMFEIISKDKKEVSVIIKLVALAVSSVHDILAMYKKLIFMQQNYKFPNKAQKFFHFWKKMMELWGSQRSSNHPDFLYGKNLKTPCPFWFSKKKKKRGGCC